MRSGQYVFHVKTHLLHHYGANSRAVCSMAAAGVCHNDGHRVVFTETRAPTQSGTAAPPHARAPNRQLDFGPVLSVA